MNKINFDDLLEEWLKEIDDCGWYNRDSKGWYGIDVSPWEVSFDKWLREKYEFIFTHKPRGDE